MILKPGTKMAAFQGTLKPYIMNQIYPFAKPSSIPVACSILYSNTLGPHRKVMKFTPGSNNV